MDKEISDLRAKLLTRKFSLRLVFAWGLLSAILVSYSLSMVFVNHRQIFWWEGLLLVGAIFSVISLTVLLAVKVFYLYMSINSYRQIGRMFHDVSHYLRDRCSEVNFVGRNEHLFKRGEEFDLGESFLSYEKNALNYVSRKAANVFACLTGKQCTVKVFLKYSKSKELVKQIDHKRAIERGELFVFFWAGGGMPADSTGDSEMPEKITKKSVFYAVNQARENENSMTKHFVLRNDFRKALAKEFTGTHLYGDDVEVQPGSVIIVPIACRTRFGGEDIEDCVGYLSLECSSKNRFFPDYSKNIDLDWPEHVQYLAGFADQIYTFISTVRIRFENHDC
jgi:hypothetical protein